MKVTDKTALKLLNLFVEPKLLPECAVQKRECPIALTPPSHLRTLDGMMKRMERAFKALGVEYVACAGTALGAARHQGFIPWDDDSDYFVTPAGLKFLMKKEVRDKLLQKYKLKVVTTFAPFGTLKLVMPGKTMSTSPFIDLFATRERVDSRGKRYLTSTFMVTLSLNILNPGGTNITTDRLYLGVDYEYDREGNVRFLTKKFKWYDREILLPASGLKYVRRVFGNDCLTKAVLRLYVPAVNKSHKFRDIKGVYRLEGDLRPKLDRGGNVLKPAAAGEIRSRAAVRRDPDNPRYQSYWGNERTLRLRK